MKTKSKKRKSQKPKLQPLDVSQRYTVEEALAYLRTSRATIYKLINAAEPTDKLQIIKEGKRTFVPGSEIARLSSVQS
jgi:hypothetical protein